MMDRYGKNSLTELTDDELQDFDNYVKGNPTFTRSKKATEKVYQQREAALIQFIRVLEAEITAKGEPFDKMRLTISKAEIQERLKKRAPRLFNIANHTFNTFWAKQQVCSGTPGPK